MHAGVGDLAAVRRQHDGAVGNERIRESDAELAGQMIVAGAREAQRIILRGARLMARRHLDCSNRLDAFQHAGDQRRGNAVVAIAALFGDGQRAAR